MTFLSIFFALLAEQFQPLRADNPVYAAIKTFVRRMERWFNAGHASDGRLAWFLTIAALMLPTALLYWLCHYTSPFLALACNVRVAAAGTTSP